MVRSFTENNYRYVTGTKERDPDHGFCGAKHLGIESWPMTTHLDPCWS